MTIRRRIVASFGLMLLLILGMAGIAGYALTRVDRRVREVRTDSLPGLSYDARSP